jgi:hypothetical protein
MDRAGELIFLLVPDTLALCEDVRLFERGKGPSHNLFE